MGTETILAIIAACAIIAAALMTVLAYRMHEDFTHFSCAYAKIFQAQSELIEKMMKLKAEAAENERD